MVVGDILLFKGKEYLSYYFSVGLKEKTLFKTSSDVHRNWEGEGRIHIYKWFYIILVAIKD